MTRRPGLASMLCAAIALLGFAGNSLLARPALGGGHADAATFTFVRLVSGALVLLVLAQVMPRRSRGPVRADWGSAFALFAYAALFSFAYIELGASVGALILFAAVQVTMIGRGLAGGERPPGVTWLGFLMAGSGLVYLTLPGLHAPDPMAAALMAAAGVAWGVYSLRGRGTADPLGATAGNFAAAVPFAAALGALAWSAMHVSRWGLLLAILSGALASGVGYSFWYAALPSLSATQAAIAQLTVPVLTAAAAVWLLHEPVTVRLLVSGAAILAGVLLALFAGQGRQAGGR